MSAAVGFFGKIPSRGDFVQAGLSRPLVQAWDRWIQHVLHDAALRLGERWEPAWQVAPVWRFCLPAGQCGPSPVLGLWLASIDAAGRRFPLMIAAEGASGGTAFLDAAEEIGREAIGYDLTPQKLFARLHDAPAPALAAEESATAEGRWWSEGGPMVGAATLTFDRLPDAAAFSGMLHP